MDHPIALVHIPKTAGTSIRTALAGHFGLERCSFNYGTDYQDVRSVNPLFSAGHVPASSMLKRNPGARLLTCVRNPLHRLISLDRFLHKWAAIKDSGTYAWYRQTHPDLPQLAAEREKHFGGCIRQFLDVSPQEFAAIVRHEHLAIDWPLALKRLGLPPLELQHIHRGEPYRDYSAEELARARGVLADEFACYERYARIGSKRLRFPIPAHGE